MVGALSAVPAHRPDGSREVVAGFAVDLCAGPGGWDVYAEGLGLDVVGVEWDDNACATRRAAGLRTVQDDVSRLHPDTFAAVFGRPEGVIGSPPCQLFSSAGKGAGRAKAIMSELLRAIEAAAAGASDVELARFRRRIRHLLREHLRDLHPKARRAWVHAEADRMSRNVCLVWQPARWIMRLRPDWAALEQVPPVLPLWKALARGLERQGYSTWAGVLSSERYGVPQTRKRAILLARRDGVPHPPEATHQEYVPGEPAREGEASLFGPALKPWVSMAQALGWGMTSRPSVTIPGADNAHETHGGPRPLDGGSGARQTIRSARERGEWLEQGPPVTLTSNAQQKATRRSADEPAPTIKGGHDAADRRWVVDTGNTRSGTRDEGRARDGDEPAQAITTRADQLEVRDADRDEDDPEATWTRERPAPTVTGSRRSRDGALVGRQLADGEGVNVGGHGWTEDRPATTVAGDPRVFPPGHKLNADDVEAGRGGQLRSGAGHSDGDARTAAVRVSVQEAAVLQSFPPWWPWQGTRTAQFQQVGNAIPPVMARAILEAVRS